MPRKQISLFEELKRNFERAGLNPYQGGSENPRPKCAIFDQIGQLAIEGDVDALKFLASNISNSDHFIRYAVVGFLGDMPIKHLKKAGLDAIQLLSKLSRSERDVKIFDFAQEALRKIKNKK